MRDRFRTFDSKITFFAFADIITAVSGMLIFITLLLATDLGRPTDDSQSADSDIERRLKETLSQQVELDAQNQRLQELFTIADTAPDLEKLQADIVKLRSQLSEEKKSQAAITDQMAESAASMAARDKTLGLTDLKATIQRTIQEATGIAHEETNARTEMASLDRQVSGLQSQLLKLKAREGKLWLIPEKSATTKEPVLVTIGRTGIIVERFDNPGQRQQWNANGASDGIKTYLRNVHPTDQYIVFLVRPSGIALFQEVSKSVRDMGFEIGFDAVEEDKEILFSTPLPIDESTPSMPIAVPPTPKTASATNGNSAAPSNTVPVTTPSAPAKQPPATPVPIQPIPTQSWWQKFLKWLGLK